MGGPELYVGIGRVTIYMPANSSLKDKRKIVKSLCDRTRVKFQISIAEVADNDLMQIATLGVSCTSNSARHAADIIQAVFSYIHASRGQYTLREEESDILEF